MSTKVLIKISRDDCNASLYYFFKEEMNPEILGIGKWLCGAAYEYLMKKVGADIVVTNLKNTAHPVLGHQPEFRNIIETFYEIIFSPDNVIIRYAGVFNALYDLETSEEYEKQAISYTPDEFAVLIEEVERFEEECMK